MKPTPESLQLHKQDVDALVRAKIRGHEPVRSLGDDHWRCLFCGHVATQVRWWPPFCSDAWKVEVKE